MKKSRKVAVVKGVSLTEYSVEDIGCIINKALRKHGIVHIKRPQGLSAYDYFDIAQRLGKVWDEKHIVVDSTRKEFVYNPDKVPFHTDSIKANIIGWYCQHPGDFEVTQTFYLDGKSIIYQLTTQERKIVEECFVCRDPLQLKTASDDVGPYENVLSYSNPKGDNEGVDVDGSALKLFWIDHRVQIISERAEDVKAAHTLLAKLRHVMRGNTYTASEEDNEKEGGSIRPATYRVKLRQGDFVFVDNNRILHGRAPISKTSKRHLYRLYINTDGWLEEHPELLVRTSHPEGNKRKIKEEEGDVNIMPFLCCFMLPDGTEDL